MSHSLGAGISSHVVKWPVWEVDHSLPSSAEVGNEWSCTSAASPSWHAQRKLYHFTIICNNNNFHLYFIAVFVFFPHPSAFWLVGPLLVQFIVP